MIEDGPSSVLVLLGVADVSSIANREVSVETTAVPMGLDIGAVSTLDVASTRTLDVAATVDEFVNEKYLGN
jgi:hypothetical protein